MATSKPTKPLKGRNYGSIPHLSTSKLGFHDKFIEPGQESILLKKPRDKHDYFYVTEKLDGTNVGILKKNGKLIPLQRSGYRCLDSPYEQHKQFYKWALGGGNNCKFKELLNEGERIVGEWIWQASGIHYKVNRRKALFTAFDIFNSDNTRKPYSATYMLCMQYNINRPRLLYSSSKKIDLDFCIDRLNQPVKSDITPVDGQLPEGLVLRCERNGQFDFMAKWVRPDYLPGRYLPGIGVSEKEPIKLNQVV